MCALCAEGFYKNGRVCSPCPNVSKLLLVGYAVLALTIVIFLIFILNRSKNYTGTVGIATSFFQVLAVIANLNVNWPKRVTDVVKTVTAPFTLNTDILASECSLPRVTYVKKWILTMMLPFLFMALFIFVFLVARLLIRVFKLPTDVRALKNKTINAYVLLLGLGYITLVTATLDIFGCTRQKDGTWTLNKVIFIFFFLFYKK